MHLLAWMLLSIANPLRIHIRTSESQPPQNHPENRHSDWTGLLFQRKLWKRIVLEVLFLGLSEKHQPKSQSTTMVLVRTQLDTISVHQPGDEDTELSKTTRRVEDKRYGCLLLLWRLQKRINVDPFWQPRALFRQTSEEARILTPPRDIWAAGVQIAPRNVFTRCCETSIKY